MEYYIKDTEKADGPYDMMAMIRKLRNGSVNEHTLIATTLFEEPKPASQYDEFADYFTDEDEGVHQVIAQARPTRNLLSLLSLGTDFLKNHMGAAMYSGLFMILWVLIAMATMTKGGVILPLVGIGLSYFLMGGYLYGILRFVRGNPVDAGLVMGKMGSTAINMGVVSLVVAVLMLPPIMLAHLMSAEMMVLTLPILFLVLLVIFTLFSFTPLLITQKGLDFWDAMHKSLNCVTRNKGQHLGNVFGLMALNFLLCFMMPIVFPVTMAALVELYDENFE